MTPEPLSTLPILYLDFDGVLHPDAVYRERGRIVLRRDGIALFEWAPLLEELLMRYPEIRLVLSTSWVRVIGFDDAKRYLSERLQQRVIGATYHPRLGSWDKWRSPFDPDPFTQLTRFEQIQQHVHGHAVAHWVALDDDIEHWPDSHTANLVAMDGDLGLGERGKTAELGEKLEWIVRSAKASQGT